MGEAGAFVVFVLGDDFEVEEVGCGEAGLGPGTCVYLGGAVVVEDYGFVGEVEAITDGHAGCVCVREH